MSDTTNVDDPIIARKRALIAEGAARNPPIKLDMRYAVDRMEDMLAGKTVTPAAKAPAPAPAPARAEPAKPDPEVELKAMQEKMAAQQRELDEARKALAAKAAGPAYSVPPGTLTSNDLGPSPAVQSDELALAWRKATELGIAGALPKGASIDQVMKRITEHLAAKAQEAQILEEQARIKAAQPYQKMVRVRILKKGDGKVGKGIHLPGIGNSCHRWGDIVEFTQDIAKAQEDNGYVEIIEDATASAA
jgi:hypothetical protein